MPICLKSDGSVKIGTDVLDVPQWPPVLPSLVGYGLHRNNTGWKALSVTMYNLKLVDERREC